MRRTILLILLVAPLVACNTVHPEADGGSFAALSAKGEEAALRTGSRSATRKAGAHKDAGRYFVEFRSRYALSYGHSFLVHGRLNQQGAVGELSAKNVAGFHPAGAGSELWMAGHLVPVPAETGPSDGDLEEEYVSARYRVYVSEDEYRKVAGYIKSKQASAAPWHAAAHNCNAWIGDVARFMGLRAPDNPLLFPANYINEMERLNAEQRRAMPDFG